MGAMPAAQHMTAAEFLSLPPLGKAHYRQLIDGEVVVNAPSWMHGDSLIAILTALRNWVRAGSARGGVNAVEVLLDDHNVYQPDIVWYRDGRSPKRGDPAPYAPPDLAVEVRSPSTWRYDIGVKKATYEHNCVAELWLVDTAADVVLVFARSAPEAPTFDACEELGRDATLTSPLLPGFALPVAEIFGD